MPTSANPRIVFHAGAGKTGTSSIQTTLRESPEALRERGVIYVGLMCEYAPVKKYPWQVFGANNKLHSLPDEEGAAQVLDVLSETVRYAREHDVHTIIWSSESFFDRPAKAISALRTLRDAGTPVQIVIYVRRHDAWAKSAYVQWGIKHKVFKGKVPVFADWVKRRPVRFMPNVSHYLAAFGADVALRNMDATRDVVSDFMGALGIDTANIPIVTENTRPSNANLLLRTLYNDKFPEPTIAVVFDRAFSRTLGEEATASEFLARYLPSDADIDEVRRITEADRRGLDALLQAQGQALIHTTPIAPQDVSVNSEHLLLALAKLVIAQSVRIDNLERALGEQKISPSVEGS